MAGKKLSTCTIPSMTYNLIVHSFSTFITILSRHRFSKKKTRWLFWSTVSQIIYIYVPMVPEFMKIEILLDLFYHPSDVKKHFDICNHVQCSRISLNDEIHTALNTHMMCLKRIYLSYVKVSNDQELKFLPSKFTWEKNSYLNRLKMQTFS